MPPMLPVVVFPAAPSLGLTGTVASISGDMSKAHLAPALTAVITLATDTTVIASVLYVSLQISGTGFSVGPAGQLNGGMATFINYLNWSEGGESFSMNLNMKPTPMLTLADWLDRDATGELFAAILSGNDRITLHQDRGVVFAYDGDDSMRAAGSNDTVWAGAGNDVINASFMSTPSYLRGEDGNDHIIGGSHFDDINGNKGRDTVNGAEGNDWVVGGQDDDLLFGGFGNDIVYGNIGDDTVVGDYGNDWVRGGQGDDFLLGGEGNDFMSGDRGNDTIWGGAGADQFNLISGAAGDRVMDFNAAEGAFVTIEGNLPYTLTFVGGDAVIDIGNGDRMILVGVSNSSPLGANWLH